MGLTSSKCKLCASRNSLNDLPHLKANLRLNSEMDLSNNTRSKITQYKFRPPHEYCPHCKRIIRTSTEIEKELMYLMKLAKQYTSNNQNDDGNVHGKLYFAGIKKYPRPIKKSERQKNKSEEIIPAMSQVSDNDTEVSEKNEESIYDQVTRNYLETSSLDLGIYYNSPNEDVYCTPRSLHLSDTLWRY